MKKLFFILLVLLISGGANAQNTFRIAWSHYTGWEPWGYAQQAGILQKWAQKYGIVIELTLVNDYVESINSYTAGQFDGCVMTNMDALTIPAVSGVDSTALIIGDFSNGNDGVVIKGGSSVKDLKGRAIRLVEYTVSHYMLVRALEMNGMTERDVTTINTSDAIIAAKFSDDPTGAAATWNPQLQQARYVQGAAVVFDSSKIPGEIMDLLVVRTNAPDSLKKALVGAWYETLAVMSSQKGSTHAIEWMAKSSGVTTSDFKAQLAMTAMFYKAADAAVFAMGNEVKKTMEYVRSFSFSRGLFGKSATSKDFVGIEFPDGAVIGDKQNIKLRFDATYMQMAADKKL